TRGGAAAVLNEIVQGLDVGILLNEKNIPYAGATRAVADMLGLDLLHVASEGRVILLCSQEVAEPLLQKWRAMPEGAGAVAMGSVTGDAGRVVLKTLMGGHRMVDVPQGELLPRIC
ncbi:MAG: AIR synthase-related protein, partial [Lentisphaerota bacterium]